MPPTSGASFVSRLRNTIGFHYDPSEIRTLVNEHITEDSVGEATAAEVGGLGRMADLFVFSVLDRLAGGDLLAGGERSRQTVGQALDVAGGLTTVVDHLVDSLVAERRDAVIEQHEGVVEIPPLVVEARADVEMERKKAHG